MTIEDVAARAGVSKTTIYRRYRTKFALVAGSATESQQFQRAQLDTGSFRGDLTAITDMGVSQIHSMWGRVIPSILAEAADDPEIAEGVRGFFAWRREAVSAMVRRGIERGEVRNGTDPEIVFDLMTGPLLSRLMLSGEPLDQAFIERLVEGVIRGVEAG